MEHRRKIGLIIASITLAAILIGVGFAVYTTTQPIPNSITIMGSQSFKVYTDAAHTIVYAGQTLNYGQVLQSATNDNGPPITFYCVNTGQMSLQVSFNSTALPNGITWAVEYSTNGFATYQPLTPNTAVTVPAGGEIDFGFNLNLASPAFGTYTWTTTIYALGY